MAFVFVLIGQPGVGKSTLLKAFAGAYVAPFQYPGTDVDLAEGTVWLGDRWARVFDTPGISSFRALRDQERVTRELLLSNPGAVVILVAKPSRLVEGMLLAIELAELDVPLVMCVNHVDETSEVGVSDLEMSAALRAPVVSTVASRREGLEVLGSALRWASVPVARVPYPDALEMAVATIARALGDGPHARGLALLFLSGDETVRPRIEAAVPADLFEHIMGVADALTRHMGVVAPVIGTMRRLAAGQLVREAAVSAQRASAGGRTGSAAAATSEALWRRFSGGPRNRRS